MKQLKVHVLRTYEGFNYSPITACGRKLLNSDFMPNIIRYYKDSLELEATCTPCRRYILNTAVDEYERLTKELEPMQELISKYFIPILEHI